jgi:hypothetical protein
MSRWVYFATCIEYVTRVIFYNKAGILLMPLCGLLLRPCWPQWTSLPPKMTRVKRSNLPPNSQRDSLGTWFRESFCPPITNNLFPVATLSPSLVVFQHVLRIPDLWTLCELLYNTQWHRGLEGSNNYLLIWSDRIYYVVIYDPSCLFTSASCSVYQRTRTNRYSRLVIRQGYSQIRT